MSKKSAGQKALQDYLREREDVFLEVDFWDYGGETGAGCAVKIDYDKLVREIAEFESQMKAEARK